MEIKKNKTILIILLIVTILATDFFVLSSGIKTYATQLNKETNNENIEFSVYFKDGENKDSIKKSIKDENVKLYAEIKVKNEGYLKEGTTIELENSNFNLKNEILPTNTHINSIEGNKVNLKQIKSDETVEIELGIEPIIKEKITTDFLTKSSKINMIGSYVYSKEEDGQSIKTDRTVCVEYQPDETTQAELKREIITNQVISIDGTNQRVIQLSIKSRISNNEYPVEQTTINLNAPILEEKPTDVYAIAINETTRVKSIETDAENGTSQIILSNDPDSNNEIKWDKNTYDEIVVTYMYPETVDVSKIETTVKSKIKLYNFEKTYEAEDNTPLDNKELNNVVIAKTENITSELYKGKIYAKQEEQYSTKTSIIITNANAVDTIKVQEGADVFETEEGTISANIKYISTTINLEKMLNVLGQDGNINIKNRETITNINEDSETDANGNVVIKYENGAGELEITTSKPVNVGIIKLEHTKAIMASDYETTQIQKINTLNTNGNISTSLSETKIVESSIETSKLKLNETITKAEFTTNKTVLSTTESNELTLGIKLITNGTQYDLYKNPQMIIKFPSTVENVELIATPTPQNANEFTIDVGTFNKTNKTLTLKLNGEQKSYPESELTQGYVQLNLKVTLNSFAISQTDKIIMAYTNENATQYYGGRTDAGLVEQNISISAPSQLIKKFDISLNENTSLTDIIMQKLDKKILGQTVDFKIKLINNKDSNLNNLKILGKLPTTNNVVSEQDQNMLETNLKEIVAENATIYYTENSNATLDVENTENGWKTDLIENAKMYLIKIENLEREQEFEATVTIQIPNSINEDVISYSQYEVTYDTETTGTITENSRIIGLMSPASTGIKTEIVAQVGQDTLKAGDTIKEGEVIRYIVTVKNNETKTFKDVQLNLNIPEGTTYVRPIDNFVYANVYYEEITDSEELSKITTITIPELTSQNTYTTEYEVRVNKGTAGSKVTNKVKTIYDEIEVESNKTENSIEEGDVRVSVKRGLDLDIKLENSEKIWYVINIDNLTDKKLENLEVEIITEGFEIKEINNEKTEINTITLSEKEEKILYLKGIIDKNTREVGIYVIVKDTNGKTYRSNLLEKENVPYLASTITMTSPQDKSYIEEGDIVEYNITVKNIGEEENYITIYDSIPQILQIKSISKDGKIIIQSENEEQENYFETIDNLQILNAKVEANSICKFKIYAKVKAIKEAQNGTVVTNNAYTDNDSSKIITHILKAKESDLKNTISGNVWYDKNRDGQKDTEEENMKDIIVRLYDIEKQEYLCDEDDEIIQTTTDSKGIYSFSKIENGSYMLIFEYDAKKYEPTIQNAEGVESSLNSKAEIKSINIEGRTKQVTAINVGKVEKNIFDMNLGLKENTGDWNNTVDSEEPSTPDDEDESNIYSISGLVWLDLNEDGQKDTDEESLKGIEIRLYNVSEKSYLKDENGKVIKKITNENGKYEFNNIQKGSYIVIFKYDTEKYELANQNSNIVLKNINIDEKEQSVALTDTLSVQADIIVNLKLKEKKTFDLELNKYISKIVVQTSKETKTYNYDRNTLGKVEIHRKQLEGANVILEYTIAIKNTGEIAGYAKNIIDYLPKGLIFSSELNADWYLSEGNLYTKSLENIELKPGEETNVKLILTKVMTSENVGLINNQAEIYEDYNQYGESDIDSTPNNQVQSEDDFGTTDVIIQIATGGSIVLYIILALMNFALIGVAIFIMIKNGIIEIEFKRERR